MVINGNLKFHTLGSGELQNAILERMTTTERNLTSHAAGRIVFDTTDNVFYFSNGAAWSALATGGSASAIQAEVDAIESTLGTLVNANGTTNVAAALTNTYFGGATDLTTALQNLASAVSGKDSLAELLDVNVATGLTTGQFLRYDGVTAKWINHTFVLADVTDVIVPVAQINLLNGLTAAAAELNILDGATLSTAELNVLDGIPATLTALELGYVDGVTSSIQTQLDAKQPLDAGLSALATGGTGIVVQNGDTVAWRSLVQPSQGVTITNPDGVAGAPTFALANDLAQLEGFIGTGFAVRTGVDTWAQRDVATASVNRITVTNGDGVIASPTIDLATVTNSGTGSFLKLATDSWGRVTGTTAVVASDITGLVDATYVNVSGDTMASTANLTFTGGGEVLGLPGSPSGATAATSKAYVDSLVSAGASWRNPIVSPDLYEITATEPGTPVASTTYIASAAGTWTGAVSVASGDVLEWSGTAWLFLKALAVGDRFIITGEHGTGVGTVLGAFVIGGHTVVHNDLVQYAGGTVTTSTSWTLPEGHAGLTPTIPQGTTVLDANATSTDYGHTYLYNAAADAWVEIAGPGSIGAGIGLSYSGNTLNVNVGAGIVELPTDEVGIDLFDASTGAIVLTTTGSNRSTASGAKLHLLLPAGSGLTQDATGLYVGANQITNAMILNETITLDADDVGTATVALGGTLAIFGTSAQGISTSISAGNIIITASDATTTQKGVASFATADFDVTAGVVTIKAGGVDNSQLAFSSITVAGTATSDAVALGETLTVVGGSSPITTTSALNTLTIDIADATTTSKGLASFSSNFFTVTAGQVDLAATLDDLTNVSSADAAATGSLLVKTAGDWQPATAASVVNTVSINDLSDVVTTTPSATQALIFNGTNWVNQSVYFLHTQGTAATTWTVTHNLGVKFVNATVYDNTDNVIIPQSIVATSTTVTTITFNTAVAGAAVIMGVA